MRPFVILILLLALVAPAFAQSAPTIVSGYADGSYVLTITNGVAKITTAPHLTPNGPVIPVPPVPPTPVPPQPPATGLKAVTEAALQAVPTYESRDSHLKGIAFTLGLVSGQLEKSKQSIPEIRGSIKSLSSIAGEDSGKWEPFFTAVDNQIGAMAAAGQITTTKQLAEAYATVYGVLDAAIPDSGNEGEYGGIRNYGLDKADPQFWIQLIRTILPLILQLLEL